MIASYGAIALLVIVLLLGALIVLPLTKSYRAIRVLRVAAWLTAGLIALATVGSVLTLLLENRLTVDDVDVIPFWPTQPDDVTIETRSTLIQGALTSASLIVEGLPIGTRLMLAGGALLEASSTITLLALIGVGCQKMLSGNNFAPVLERLARLAGVVVLVAGTVGSVLSQLGRHAAGMAALDISSASWSGPTPDSDWLDFLPKPTLDLHLDLLPLILGGALLALAILLRRGTVLQSETEGLV